LESGSTVMYIVAFLRLGEQVAFVTVINSFHQ
jgi:hypothetical protein